MPDVADDLIAEALDALEVEDVSAMRGGGQKSVRLVRKGDEQLVLKVIALGSSTPAALRRAQREVELLQSLDSPHIVRVESDLVELGDPVRGAAWLEECLDGQDLGAVVGHPWDWDEAVKVASDVAIGLGAAHAAKVVHRDLSANNVRRLSTGRYKVMDFGFARFTLLSGVTVGGQPGTPGYFTPEHVHTYSGGPTALQCH